MKKNIYRTAAVVTGLSIAERALGFLYRIVLSRLIGAEGLGLYQVALSVFSVFITLGTGGMYSKLLAARRAAQLGVPTYILPGREPDIIARAFASGLKGTGTWVCPRQHAIPQRKFWLAYKTEPLGTIEVDDGAAEALLNRGKSLLPGGIVSVEGTFQKGAPVRVTHNGVSIGVGLSNYSSAEIERIRGLKRIEVAAILGDAHYPEVIHRDNLLLGAAV